MNFGKGEAMKRQRPGLCSCRTGQHPYAGLRSFTPQRGGELRLYQAVREAVPVVDAAVCKLIRLSGGTKGVLWRSRTEKRLQDFWSQSRQGGDSTVSTPFWSSIWNRC